MSTSLEHESIEHEIVKGNVGYLIEDYLLGQGVDFVATGSFSQEREVVASAQADELYCFGASQPIPDLAIEVILTSGGPDKLKRHADLGVAEVWFWEAGGISVYQLQPDGYQKLSESQFVQGIDLDRLAHCAVIESHPQAVRTVRQCA